MVAVILAAGQGTRMKPLTDKYPKPLLPVNDETLLSRLLRQLRSEGLRKFVIVTGHRSEELRQELDGPGVVFLENTRYREDTNGLSMFLALSEATEDALIFEADLLMTDECVAKIVKAARETPRSLWFTVGPFTSAMSGGILRATAAGELDDLRIVPVFDEKWKGFKKLLGVMKVSAAQLPEARKLLRAVIDESTKLYYLEAWIRNLSALRCYECDVTPEWARSFNTVEDYERALAELGRRENWRSA